MTNEANRQAWERIQADESVALQAQQASAGVTHAPVRGPGPHGDHRINMVVEEAVAWERARCMDIVNAWAARETPGHREVLLRLAVALK